MSRSSLFQLASLVFCLAACTGCGGVGALHPVTGKVTLDGKPLADGQLALVPDVEKGNNTKATPFAKIQGGSYTVSTNGLDGAPAGWYKVMIQTQYPGGPEKAVVLPKRYTDPGKSGLSVEVPSSKADAFDLKLTTQVNAQQ